jgi:hypothetical protein
MEALIWEEDTLFDPKKNENARLQEVFWSKNTVHVLRCADNKGKSLLFASAEQLVHPRLLSASICCRRMRLARVW